MCKFSAELFAFNPDGFTLYMIWITRAREPGAADRLDICDFRHSNLIRSDQAVQAQHQPNLFYSLF